MHFSTVLAVARTQSKSDDFGELIVRTAPNILNVDTRSYGQLINHNEDNTHYRAIIIEVDTPSASNQTLDIIKKTRTANPTGTIFVVVTFATSSNKAKYYIAGADHCVQVVEHSPEKKLLLFSAFFNDAYWLNNADLLLDQDRLCIYGADKKLEVSFVEMKVLDALIRCRMMSHDEIASVMGLNIRFYDVRALEKSISRLRNKIKNHYGSNIIQNIRGYGYKLCRGLISAHPAPSVNTRSSGE